MNTTPYRREGFLSPFSQALLTLNHEYLFSPLAFRGDSTNRYSMTLDEALQVIERQQRQIDALVAENRALRERVAELEREVARQAAPFRREEAKKIPPEQQKRPGRKKGHRG